MVITNCSKEVASPWIQNSITEKHSLSSDWDNCWHTGGAVDKVCEEAHFPHGGF
jgi:hypothetical protein